MPREDKPQHKPTRSRAKGKTQDEPAIERVCAECHHYVVNLPPDDQKQYWGLEVFGFGECHGGPPTALGTDVTEPAPNAPHIKIRIKMARFPHVAGSDTCGAWKQRDGAVKTVVAKRG